MNLPNKLTLFRVLLIPVCCLLLGLGLTYWAAGVFLLAAITDFLDGYIARRQKLVTTFGKFADPVADKQLVLTAMIFLVQMALLPAWAVCIVAARELAVDGLRLVAAGRGQVVAAKMLGKLKTNAQFLCVLSAMLSLPAWLTLSLTVIMAALTVVSGAQYFWTLRGVLMDREE